MLNHQKSLSENMEQFNSLFRYGSRALWSLQPSFQVRIKRRGMQLRESNGVASGDAQSADLEDADASLSDTPARPRPRFPLITNIRDPERICIILQKRIAEYARAISHVPGLSFHREELDANITSVIGMSTAFNTVTTVDLLQAYIGAYIYNNILLSNISLGKLEKQDWERKLGKWLRNNFHLKGPLEHGILTLVMDTALSFKALVEHFRLKLDWPQSGVDFDEKSMVSWSRHVPPSSTVVLALTFMVSKGQHKQGTINEGTDDEETDDEEIDDKETDDEETDDEEPDDEEIDDEEIDDEETDKESTNDEMTDDEGAEDEGAEDEGISGQILYPSTVISQTQGKSTQAHLLEEIKCLRHLMTSDRRVWTPIQSSALQIDRDWCGNCVQESHAEKQDLKSERPTKRRKI